MQERRQKAEIVTFKVDSDLMGMLQGIANRSEFIRNSILSALGCICPLCGGRGILSPMQKTHWLEFKEDHPLEECSQCHEIRIVCEQKSKRERRNAGRGGCRS